jgi:3-oxoacyl-[acyl-carrier protein] reductase
MIYPNVLERSRAGSQRAGETRASSTRSEAQQRVALVTGGTHGIGAAIARRLAHDGLAVAVNNIGEDEGDALELVRQIHHDGGIAGAFRGDVSDERQAARLAKAVAGTLGFIDVLVINATGPAPTAPVHEAAWMLRRALLTAMEAKGSGRIVKVDPEVLEPRRPNLTTSWARELAPLGITVNTIAPRYVAPAEDIAHAVSFVASESAGAITGQRIVIDGGRGPVG